MPDQILIRNGAVLTMEASLGDFACADVLIEQGRIAQVGPGLDAENASIIDATDMIVMPGLIDPHRHLWYQGFRGWGMDAAMSDFVQTFWPEFGAKIGAEDLYAFTRAGIVDALENGITSVFDWCHAVNSDDHPWQAFRAHQELPMRAVFALGGSMQRKLAEFAGDTEHYDSWDTARALRTGPLANHPRIEMALAIQGIESSPVEVARADIEAARELGIPASMHVAVLDGNPPAYGIRQLEEAGLLGDDLQFAHCVTTTADEFRSVVAADARATCTPMAELLLGFGIPPTGRMLAAGLGPSFGADTVCSASGDLFDEARTALIAERTRMAALQFATGPVENAAQLGMSARCALEGITINAAHACWLEDRVGSLSPGKLADIILLRGRDLTLAPVNNVLGTVVCGAHGANVDTVLVGGEVVKSGGELLHIDRDEIYSDLIAARDRIFTANNGIGFVPKR
jgi:5-methylthioadenosine/S-adenosylhomocysteine deaminase